LRSDSKHRRAFVELSCVKAVNLPEAKVVDTALLAVSALVQHP